VSAEEVLETFDDEPCEEVAIVGMAGRFPGAADVDELWRNLRGGVESIAALSNEELLAAGTDPALLLHPRYVKARGLLAGAELFDAPFFGLSPREAAITDPQQRVLLECAWEALEQAGVDPDTFPGRIGVYAGAVFSTYLITSLLPRAASPDESWQMVLGNDKDTLATRISYKLNLRGPSLSVQTACSTALVAVHMARQSLLDYECDLALAGGVSVRSPQASGYLYQEEGILSPDGHCRPFDARARGTVFSSGAGLVVLKRLSDARADGDTVRAVLKASAINNDGAQKIGYTAPSLDGQAEVIARALTLAGVDPETVGYVEAHGTATPIGDPIEVAGLTRAFRAAGSKRRGFCALGSVKSNFGHLDAAAGIAGLIKAVLALEHREIPPSLHFETPNPRIDFAESPFFVNGRLRPWEAAGDQLRRAGVSSFGIGGTNAHVIVEEAPAPAETDPPARAWQLLVLSAKTESARESATARLAGHLRSEAGQAQALEDVAFTLQAGRRALPWRRAVVCRFDRNSEEDAAAALADRGRLLDGVPREGSRTVAFLLPGQGGQRAGMGRELYAAEPFFRRQADGMTEILRPLLSDDLRALLFTGDAGHEEREYLLRRTALTQPALFVLETALARLWMSWGVRPDALLGHSIGEIVAAHLAGVMTLEDALALVAARGRLIGELPGGAMLAVPLPEEDAVQRLAGTDLSLAAVNSPAQCVVAGSEESVEALREALAAEGIEGRRLATSHAFHSRQMEPVLEPFTRVVSRIALREPAIPFLSNVSGRWITAAEATDPLYWARHLRQTVRFADGLAALLEEPGRALLEVGPGRTLTKLVRRLCDSRVAVPSLLPPEEGQPEPASLLTALGRLWTAGVEVDWKAFHAGERRRRVPLPSYPFERRRCFVEPVRSGRPSGSGVAALPPEAADPSGWLHLPGWRRSLPPAAPQVQADETGAWLVVLDGCGLGEAVAERLALAGYGVVRVAEGGPHPPSPSPIALPPTGRGGAATQNQSSPSLLPLGGGAPSPGGWESDGRGGQGVRSTLTESWAALLDRLEEEGRTLHGVVHCGGVTAVAPDFEQAWSQGFASLTALTQALLERGEGGVTIAALVNGAQRVTGQEDLWPAKATVLGWVRTAPHAGRPLRCRVLDVALPVPGSARWARLADRLAAEILSETAEPLVAWRDDDRWVPSLEPAPLAAPDRRAAWLRPGGSYILTGGLDGPAFALARRMAAAAPVRLAFLAPPGHAEDRHGVETLEELGAEVLVLEAEPTDPTSLWAALGRVEERWDEVHAVFYLPWSPGAIGPIGPMGWMRGALALDRLLGDDKPLDAFVLFTWLEPPAGAPARAELWAASALLDALAHERTARGAQPTVAIGWGSGAGFGGDESSDVLDRILTHMAAPQIVVSAPVPQVEEEPARPETGPDLSFDGDPIAARIAAIWREVLGVDRVGPRDRFFDLGGDSLIALRVMARLREAFPVDLPVRILFERATVPGLRDAVEESLTAKLEALSEEEAQRLVESFMS
jgi:acyl transferase domain-containing protein/acyl carrier protein